MSGSGEERGRGRDAGKVGSREVQETEEESPPEKEETAAEADRIRRIAESLDVDNLKEEALVALSDAALRLACVAKAQSTRRRHIASRRAQIEDWEARHAQAIAGVETVHHALAALRKRIDQDGMEGEDAATALNLVEHWLSVDVRYQAKHKELKHAVSDADFESVRASTTLSNRLLRSGAKQVQP